MGQAAGVNLTKSAIEALEPRAALYRVPDAQVRGLVVQVTPAGVRSWVLRFRVHGRLVNHTLGRWPELTVAQARKLALDLQGRISKGEDPAATRQAERQAETISELAKRFQKEHMDLNLKPSTKAEYLRLLNKRILPGLGSMRVKDVQPSDVARLLSRIRSATPKGIEANRTRAVLSKMFSLAALWGLRPDGLNPAHGQARASETKKDRHLSDRELLAFGETMRHLAPTPEGEERPADALPAEETHPLAALRLSLLTGMRKSEIIGDKVRGIPALSWAMVDLEAGRIRLDQHKTSRKAGARMVPLCVAAYDLLDKLPKVLGNPYVIPGSVPGESLVNLQAPWERVRAAVSVLQEKAKVPKKARVDLSDVTIHDLRRSFASLAARMGYPELIVAALLGHAAGSVTAGYARLGADPLRDVVEAIGTRMATLLDGTVDLEAEAKAMKEQVQARRTVKGA
jgi:integrase